jgi:hypothetical protein
VIRPKRMASLRPSGEAQTRDSGRPDELRGSVLKRRQGRLGGWRRNGYKGRASGPGRSAEGREPEAEVRASIVVMKRRNGRGAKGGRKVDTR